MLEEFLENNGGPTQTHALRPDSDAAIDAGNDQATPGSGGSACESSDQRGFPRPINCDIGAFEFQALQGDVDNDEDVDLGDFEMLLDDLNKPVGNSVCGQQCDLDGDGQITSLDAVLLVLRCTRPNCATQ